MRKTQILVVEDSTLFSNIIQKSLKRLGYDVSAAVSSGEEAIKKVEYIRPDLVLMDIVLEGEMDGIEAADKIRSLFSVPVIYLTGRDAEKIVEKAKITEPYGYLIKPFKEKELRATIEMALYKSKIEKELKNEFEKWQRLTVRRENRMSELKEEITDLKKRLEKYEPS
jgi:DNA-binding response OmpR family regulator